MSAWGGTRGLAEASPANFNSKPFLLSGGPLGWEWLVPPQVDMNLPTRKALETSLERLRPCVLRVYFLEFDVNCLGWGCAQGPPQAQALPGLGGAQSCSRHEEEGGGKG